MLKSPLTSILKQVCYFEYNFRNNSFNTTLEIEAHEKLNCGICGEEFFTNLKLEKHIKSEHFNENGSAQCNECKVKRSNYKLLVKHKKLKHKVKKIKKLKLVNKVKIEDEENCKLCDVSVEKCQIYDHYKENHGGIPVKIGGNDLIECIKCAPSNSNPVFVESVEQLLKHIEEFHKGGLISENISL